MACQRAIKSQSACRSASKSFFVLLLVGMLFMSFGFWFLRLQRCGVISGRQGNFEIGDDHGRKRYLYWGSRIDCPGKHCLQCGGLGHQESSLRCALEEALFLNRLAINPHSSNLLLRPLSEVCEPVTDTSNSTYSFGCWMGSQIVVTSKQLWNMKIVIQSFTSGIDNTKIVI